MDRSAGSNDRGDKKTKHLEGVSISISYSSEDLKKDDIKGQKEQCKYGMRSTKINKKT